MGNKDKCGLQTQVEFADFCTGLDAQFRIQVGKGFVKEEDVWSRNMAGQPPHAAAVHGQFARFLFNRFSMPRIWAAS